MSWISRTEGAPIRSEAAEVREERARQGSRQDDIGALRLIRSGQNSP